MAQNIHYDTCQVTLGSSCHQAKGYPYWQGHWSQILGTGMFDFPILRVSCGAPLPSCHCEQAFTAKHSLRRAWSPGAHVPREEHLGQPIR